MVSTCPDNPMDIRSTESPLSQKATANVLGCILCSDTLRSFACGYISQQISIYIYIYPNLFGLVFAGEVHMGESRIVTGHIFCCVPSGKLLHSQ